MAIGVDTVRHRRRRRELPLAAIPLLLGAHQLTESLVWWGVEDRLPHEIGHIATWAYLLFAFCVLPLLVPVAVMAIEPTRGRRWLMAPFLAIGAGVSGVLVTGISL